MGINSLISKTNRIFIAGHKGMVGKSILNKFVDEQYKSLLTESKANLDLTNLIQVRNWFAKHKPEVVIIAAAKVGGIKANDNFPVEFLLENLKIQNNLIETSWKNNVKRLIFLGSSCIYPKFAPQPIREESLLTSSLEPSNEAYALAKITGIKLCMALRKQYNFDCISLMPTNLYGPGDNYNAQNSHVIPGLIQRFYEAKTNDRDEVICWGTGSPLREFLHVEDLADACLHVLEKWSPKKSELPFLNVGTGKDLRIKDLTKLISELIGFKGNIKWDTNQLDGTPKKLLDISRLQATGWNYKIDLKDGLASTIKGYIEDVRNGKVRN